MASKVSSTKTTTKKTTTTRKSTSTRTSTATALKTLKNIPVQEVKLVNAADVKYTECYKNFSSSSPQTNLGNVLDDTIAPNTFNHLENQINSIKKENQSLTDNNNQLKQQLKNLDNEYQMCLQKIEQLKKDNINLLNSNDELNAFNAQLKQSCESKNNQDNLQLETLKKQLSEQKNAINHLNNQLNHLTQVNTNLKKQNENLNNELNKAHLHQQQTPPPPKNHNEPTQSNQPNQTNADAIMQKESEWLKTKALLEEQISILNNNLENERAQLINKLQAKSKEAQVLIDKKIAELEENKKAELLVSKSKIYEDLVCRFLEPILLFEQTIKSSANNPAIANYLQGFNMIVNMFKDILASLGASEININVGDEFNAEWMSAFDVVDDPSFKHNQVTRVVSKGYVLNQKVIKFASVVVAK